MTVNMIKHVLLLSAGARRKIPNPMPHASSSSIIVHSFHETSTQSFFYIISVRLTFTMLLYPHDIKLLGLCFIIPTIFEVLRLVVAAIVVAPPRKIKELEQEKFEAKFELASIKSVQVEFIRHSKLQREIIRIDRELEILKANQQPKADKLKYIMHIVRVSFHSSLNIVKNKSL
jgi:hypothetical protein